MRLPICAAGLALTVQAADFNIRRRFGARRLDVFGSAARGDFDPAKSDLDFLVEFDDMPPAQYAEAYFSLKEGLERLFGRTVDLVTDSSLANPYFRSRIAAESRNVYAR